MIEYITGPTATAVALVVEGTVYNFVVHFSSPAGNVEGLHVMSYPKRPPVIEMVDDDMAAVLRRKTGWERLRIVDALYDTAWQLIEWNVRSEHADWNESQVRGAVAKRIADAAK